MTELEKVVAGLECCIKRDPDDKPRCQECPYDGACLNRLKSDALAILKAEEPRVLTLDEIVENGGEAPIYLECPDVVGVTPVIYQPDAFEDGYLVFTLEKDSEGGIKQGNGT